MTAMTEKATGAVTVAIGGVTAVFGHSDVEAWGNSLLAIAPLLLILFLIWRIHKLDQQHKDCQEKHERLTENQAKMQEQLLLTFLATKHPGVACELPTVKDFKDNTFVVPEH